MRIDVKETKVYPFKELTDEAQQKAIEQLADINVDHNWWDVVYEDATNVGIKITAFDCDYEKSCEGELTLDAEEVAINIVNEHGDNCSTYETATGFMAAIRELRNDFMLSDDDLDEEDFIESDDYEDLVSGFEDDILEDYRIILQKEYEYLTSEEAIVETIEANEYEFTEDGKLY